MASRKPLTQSAGLLEQLQAVDTLTVGDYDLPNAISDDGKMLITVNSAAVWDYASHVDLTNITVDDHHAQSHTHNGSDDSGVVEHDDTANITVDDHHDKLHTHNGADGSGVVEHDDTANITVDQHHDQTHTHNGADSSGVVEHDDTANGTIANHDTDATGTELDTLTDGSNADALHIHAAIGTSGNTTYYLATTGNDSTGNGSLAGPWKTVDKAITVIRETAFENHAVATIELAAGVYSVRDTTIQSTTPPITIQGNSVLNYTASNVNSVTANSALWDVQITVNTTTGMLADQLLGLRSANRLYMNGAWPIKSVDSGTTVTIITDSDNVTPTTGSLTSGVAFLATSIFEAADDVIFIVKSNNITFRDLAFVGGGFDDGFRVRGAYNVGFGPNVAISGFAQSGIDGLSSGMFLDYTMISNCRYGVQVIGASRVTAEGCTFSGVELYGLLAWGSDAECDACYFIGAHSIALLAARFARVVGTNSIFYGNDTGAAGFYESYVEVNTGNIFSTNNTDKSPASGEGNNNSYLRA
jgi:hypothetical protein